MRLFYTELRKILFSNHALLVMLAALILQLFLTFVPKNYEHPYSVDIYTRYTEKLEGEYIAEKRMFLQKLYEEYSVTIAEYPLHREEYLAGKMTLEEFSAYTDQNAVANAEISTVQYLLAKCEYLDNTDGFQKEIFYDTDIADFFESLGFDFIMLLVLLCVVIPVFDKEYAGRSTALILTSRYGKARLAVLKMLAATVVIFAFMWCISAVRLEAHICKHGSAFFDRAVGNLMGYDGFGNVSVLEYYLIDTFIKVVCWMVLAVKICLITVICRNTSFSFIISFLIISAPLLLNELGNGNAEMYIFDTVNLMRLYPSALHFGIFSAATAVKIIVFGLVTVRSWGYRNNIRG